MIQSIVRAMFLLELLAKHSATSLSLSELSNMAGLKAPTCHNILNTLLQLGYIGQDKETRRYFISDKATFNTVKSLENKLLEVSFPIVQKLVQNISETAILCLYQQGTRKTILAIESQQALRVTAQEGADDNFYNTATGLVLLSMLPETEFNKLIKKNPVPKDLENNNGEALYKELEKIRKEKKYSLNRNDQVQALAVPIYFQTQNVYAAIGLYFPGFRHNTQEIPKIFKQLKETAEKISKINLS